MFSAKAWRQADFCDHITHDLGAVKFYIVGPDSVLSSLFSVRINNSETWVLLAGESVSSEQDWLEYADPCSGFTTTHHPHFLTSVYFL